MKEKSFVAMLHVTEPEIQEALTEIRELHDRLYQLSQKLGRWGDMDIVSLGKDETASGN